MPPVYPAPEPGKPGTAPGEAHNDGRGDGDEPGSVVLVVDAANVVGSRPDGWWRDRAGAAARLLTGLAPLVGARVERPDGGGTVRLAGVVAVLEGAARAAPDPAPGPGGAVRVVRAERDGDSAVAAVAEQEVARGAVPLVVTADRGLRERLPAGARVAGPGWLRALLDG